MASTRWVYLTLPAALLVCSGANGQNPDKFTNLKVLPKDISKQELQTTMRGFAFALGVRCEHCHVEKKAPEKGFNYDADDKEAKKTPAADNCGNGGAPPMEIRADDPGRPALSRANSRNHYVRIEEGPVKSREP